MLEMPPSVQTAVESYLTLSSRCGSNTGRHKGMGDESVTRESNQATPNPPVNGHSTAPCGNGSGPANYKRRRASKDLYNGDQLPGTFCLGHSSSA